MENEIIKMYLCIGTALKCVGFVFAIINRFKCKLDII